MKSKIKCRPNIRFVRVLIWMLILFIGFSAQRTFPQSVDRDEAIPKWQLEVDKNSRVFEKDSQGVLSLTLSNRSKDDVYFVQMFDEYDFQIDLLDAKNKKVEISDAAMASSLLPKIGRAFLVHVGPGQKSKFEIRLANKFDMKPGRYKLTVRRFLLDKDKITERTISSKPVRIEIKI